MANSEENNGRPTPGSNTQKGSAMRLVGMLVLWLGSLGFFLELINLLFVKKFQVDFDPSLEMVIAAFFFLLTLLGGLLFWRGRRMQTARKPEKTDRNINLGILANALILVMAAIAGFFVYSSNQAYLKRSSPYVRPAPRADFTLGEFPTPVSPRPTPTYDANGKHLAGSLLGSIDHLRVGNIRISTTDHYDVINSVQMDVQRVECLVEQDGAPAVFAVNDSTPLIFGPLPVKDGRFYAKQEMGIITGKVMTEENITGTVYLFYRDPQSGRTCDLGTFEFNAFVLE